jgi:small subunit ribosomal protein S2
MREDGRFEMLTKKERLKLDKEHEGLMKNLAGIKDMNGLPDMLFIIDVRKEDIAVKEANRLGIPIVAVVDTNCSPEGITQVIPGNDDALRAIRLFASRIADAILEGQQIGTEGGIAAPVVEEEPGTVEDTLTTPTSIIPAEFRDPDEGDDDAELETEEETADEAEAPVAEGASETPAAETEEAKTEESNEATAS